jgi:hypothetical protein
MEENIIVGIDPQPPVDHSQEIYFQRGHMLLILELPVQNADPVEFHLFPVLF